MRPITPKAKAPLAALAIAALLASSCMAFQYADDETSRHHSAIKRSQDTLRQEIESYKPRAITQFIDEIWVGDTARAFRNSDQPLPPKIVNEKDITLVTALPVELQTAAYKIQQITGLEVTVEGSLPAASRADPPKHRILYDGDLYGLLNAVANSYGAHWVYDRDEDSIIFTRMITRIFDFYAPPSTVSSSASVSSSAGGGGGDGGDGGDGDGGDGGGGGGGAISYNQSSSLDEWDDIQAAITSLLPQNSHLSLSPSTGKITITTTPIAMRKVAELINKRNEYFSKQIHIGIQLIEFTITGDDLLGLNWRRLNAGAILDQIFNTTFGLSAYSIVTGGLTLPDTGGNTITRTDGAGDARTLDGVITALSTYGKVSILTTADTRTRNGKPTPIQSTVTRGYLESVQTTVQGNNADTRTTNYTPGEITTGLFMTVRPRILDRERVQIDMSVNLDTFVRLRTFGEGDTQVQQPETTTQSFTQETIIPNGATFVISGLERKSNDLLRRGTGHPDNILLGGQRSATVNRSMIIILLTPTIIKL